MTRKESRTSDIENGVRCELVKLHTINKKKPTKKFMGRKRQTVEEEGKEHHPITARELRDPLGAGKFDGVVAGDEAVHLGLLHLLLQDGRRHPAGRGVRCLSLGHLVLRRKVLHAHLTSLHLGAMHARSRKQRSAMAVAAERKSW
jgi:hypothetical protein